MSAQRRTATRRRSETRRASAPAPAVAADGATAEQAEESVRRSSVAKPVSAQERARERAEAKASARKGTDETKKSSGGVAGRLVNNERTSGIRKFSRETMAEIKKVNWPDRETTRNLTLVVIAVSLTLGLVLGGLDYVLFQIFEALP